MVRQQQLQGMSNVEIFRESRLTAEDVFAVEANHVVIATGASWRKERFDGAAFLSVAPEGTAPDILTVDDIIEGRLPTGPTLVYDEDGYYLASVISEKIRNAGVSVTYCTPADVASEWAGNTYERWRTRTHLMKLGVDLELAQALVYFDGEQATLKCQYSGAEKMLPVTSVVMVTQRRPNDALYQDILARAGGALPFTLKRIGDCEAPAIIAAAVYSGHRYARELDARVSLDDPMLHDRVDVGDTPFNQLAVKEIEQ